MKQPTIKSLKKRAENLWKQVCYKRDGLECKVQKYFPEIQIAHSDCYQVDHCIGRANKLLFLDPRNGTVVCSSCNSAKNNKMKSVSRAIDMIVKTREGLKVFDEMVALDMAKSSNPDWSRRWWLEDQIATLESYLK